MMYLQLFLSFLQIGALSFGGGYAAMPLIEAQIVTTHGWLTMTEFANLVTIAEMTPGPIAVNAATFVGTKIAGVPGALAATAGCILPACILVTLIAKLYLSAFTFGGGYVIVTLMKEKFVDELHWMEEDEMLDLIAIAQSAPGAIAVNGAIVVGYKLAGLLGALVAIVATIIPPFVIITVISYFYELFRDNFIVSKLLAGMQAGVGAVIASVVWDMGGGILKQKSAVSDFIMLAAFLATCVFRVNVVYIILACIALGVLRTVLAKRRTGA